MKRPRLVVLSDAQLLALSEVCWFCGDGTPVDLATAEKLPACERCLDAIREVQPAAAASECA